LLGALASAFRIPELRKKILYTIGLLAVYRVASFIPVPGVDVAQLVKVFGEAGLFQFLDLFAGGALMRFTVFAMGVGPYITSSIVIQLLQVVIPSLEEMAKSGVEGRRKLSQWTRYGAVILAVIQGTAITFGIRGALNDTGAMSVLLIITTLTAGTAFLMWLGEKISENGIGNGISLIIFTGIIARLPATFRSLITSVGQGGVGIVSALLYILVSLISIVGVIMITLASRRIPVQYAKRVVGRKVYGGQSTHIPLSVNQAGVIPVIFASSLLALSFPNICHTPLAKYILHRFSSALRYFLRAIQRLKPLLCGANNVERIGRSQRFRKNVANTGQFQDCSYRTACYHSCTG
jgi:preprotein translocase subunit SecY